MEIIKSHNIKSKECVKSDHTRIMAYANDMHKLCLQPLGIKAGAYAIAHCQVTDNDPLKFFVTNEGEIFINPYIINHTNVTVDSKEGCMSFPLMPDIIVQRYHKITVNYLDANFIPQVETFSGKMAKVLQHEIDHFEGVNIYGH